MKKDFSYAELRVIRNALDTEAIRLEPIAGSEKKIKFIDELTEKVQNMMDSIDDPEYYYRES